MDYKDFDTSELLQYFLQTLFKQDSEIQSLKLQMGTKDLEILRLQLENNTLKGINEASINAIKSQGSLFASGYSNLWKSHQVFADEATSVVYCLKYEMLQKSTVIDKYQKGVRQKSLVSNQKWKNAQKYLLEEIPKHKTLKAARKEAATRAGIVVEERQLVKMLPDPR